MLRNIATTYLRYNNKILMIYRAGSRLFRSSLWIGVGGHFKESELNNPQACAFRELQEKTGIEPSAIENLTLKYITISRTSKDIRQQYIYFADLKAPVKLAPSDECPLEWVDEDILSTLHMSFTNEKALHHYFQTGKNDTDLYTGFLVMKDGKPSLDFVVLPPHDFPY